jgi:hypothetical protein
MVFSDVSCARFIHPLFHNIILISSLELLSLGQIVGIPKPLVKVDLLTKYTFLNVAKSEELVSALSTDGEKSNEIICELFKRIKNYYDSLPYLLGGVGLADSMYGIFNAMSDRDRQASTTKLNAPIGSLIWLASINLMQRRQPPADGTLPFTITISI